MTVIPMTEHQEVAHRNPQQELVEWVRADDRREQIAKALPDGVSIDRFERATATALVANPDLAGADRASLYLAILSAAQRGLVPDGRQGAIVVYGKKAQFLPMIGGVRDTLAEYGWMLKTGTVRENDEIEFDEAAGTVKHPVRPGSDRGEIIAFYAVATHRDGTQRMGTQMSVAEVNEVRDKAGVAKNPAWTKWYEAMGQKTVGHRLADDVPLAPQDRRRVEWIINATELGPEGSRDLLYGPPQASFSELPAGEAPFVHDVIEVSSEAASPAAMPANDTHSETPSGDVAQDGAAVDEAAAPSTPPLDDEAEMLALEAAEYVPATGKYAVGGSDGPLTLSAIYALPDDAGPKYFRMLLGRLEGPQEYVEMVWAFCRVAMPQAYQAALEQKGA